MRQDDQRLRFVEDELIYQGKTIINGIIDQQPNKEGQTPCEALVFYKVFFDSISFSCLNVKTCCNESKLGL